VSLSASVPGTYSEVVRGTRRGVPDAVGPRLEVRVVRQEVKREAAVRRVVKEVLRVVSSESSWRFSWRRVWVGRVRRSICWSPGWAAGEDWACLGGILLD